MASRGWLLGGWSAALGAALGVRLWNALAGPLLWGYDAWGHVAYVLFLDLHGALPFADQGWSYYQPPLHYLLGSCLVRLGSGDALMRGLSLLGGAASLGVAALAARLAHWAHPERPALALAAFCAVAFLPVHLAVGNMPGNEMTATFLISAAVCAWIANERRPRPGLWGDAATGLLLALALLTKHTAFVALATVGSALVLRVRLAADRGAELRRTLVRATVLGAVVAAVAGPHYLRNLQSYGKLITTNRDQPLVSSVEAAQPPGQRRLSDYAALSLEVFTQPNPLAPHMYRSVWGSLYTNVWVDTHREADRERALEAEREIHPVLPLMAFLGLLPTGLVLAGAALALRDAGAGRRRVLYLPLLLLAAWMLLAFAIFAWIVPRWSALKAAYCLSLSLPCALFLARALEAISRRRALHAATCAVLAGTFAAGAAVSTAGLVQPLRRDAPASGAVRFYFGEYEEAARLYERLIRESTVPVAWLENLAAVELVTARAEVAERLYARAAALAARNGPSDPRRLVRLGVAQALAGERAAARASFDAALAAGPLPEALANRGALRAREGEFAGAAQDLRAALDLDPELVPAWLALGTALAGAGRADEARVALERAAEQACRAPRGHPRGVGTGEPIEWGVGRRPLLLVQGDALAVDSAAFYRGACVSLRERAGGSGQTRPLARTPHTPRPAPARA